VSTHSVLRFSKQRLQLPKLLNRLTAPALRRRSSRLSALIPCTFSMEQRRGTSRFISCKLRLDMSSAKRTLGER
jgi:hypothetical protein